jgi:hypothetical protein
MFTHAMEFFKNAQVEKTNYKTFLLKFIVDLLIKDLVSLGNLVSTKLYVTSRSQTWVPQDLKNKI